MFDTTTVSYWGKGKKAEDLLAYGYAKNKRFDLKQLVIVDGMINCTENGK